MRKTLLFLCALFISASVSLATAADRTWDFSTWTLTADVVDDNLLVSSDGKRIEYVPVTSAQELVYSNGTVIEDTKGLLFTADTKKIRLDIGSARVGINGKNILIGIPAAAGDKVTVYAKPANSTAVDRGFAIESGGTLNAAESSTFIAGDAETGYLITEANADATFVFDATGSVTVKTTGGINITKIVVTSTGGEPTPTPNTGSWDFEADALGTAYPILGWTADALVATVVADPHKAGQALKVENGNWDSAVKFLGVTLPEGKTLADVTEIKIDFALASASSDILWKSLNYWIGTDATAFVPGTKTGTVTNIVQQETLDTWVSKTFVPELADDLKALSSFDMAMGLNLDKDQVYYLDNITLVLGPATSITIPVAQASSVRSVAGGIEIAAQGQRTLVFSIDGRQVADTYDTSISLQGGMYIVKVGAEKATKVIVK